VSHSRPSSDIIRLPHFPAKTTPDPSRWRAVPVTSRWSWWTAVSGASIFRVLRASGAPRWSTDRRPVR